MDMASLQEVLKVFHTGLGVPHVLITSIELPAKAIVPSTPDAEQPMQTLVGSSFVQGEVKPWVIQSPVVPGHYSGTGDLLAALVAGKFTPGPEDADALRQATEYAVSALHDVLTKTYEYAHVQQSTATHPDSLQSVFDAKPLTLTARSANAARTELRIYESRGVFDTGVPPKFTAKSF